MSKTIAPSTAEFMTKCSSTSKLLAEYERLNRLARQKICEAGPGVHRFSLSRYAKETLACGARLQCLCPAEGEPNTFMGLPFEVDEEQSEEIKLI